MEPRYLLDTNIIIYIRRKRPEEVGLRFRKLLPGGADASSAGVQRPGQCGAAPSSGAFDVASSQER
jgi:hypothetical protein